ncbi:MAG: PEP-CTERM sorting domain-containing protein [Nitrospirota bacterium]|nr:PEP-CTERM sorting domain-containing protein [Nitrospirota bacterium]
MKIITGGFILGLAVFFGICNSYALPTSLFINEIHYDNAGTDVGEAVEIAGPAGFDLTGWSLVLYNGGNGLSYNTRALSGAILNQQNGFGTLSFSIAGIQNGAPDGLALVDSGATVIQFLSYEGIFTALNGPANGMTSVDIGVSESGLDAAGKSLQLIGGGRYSEDFFWSVSASSSFGSVNTNQRFVASAPVPEPSTMLLFAGGVVGLVAWRKRRR